MADEAPRASVASAQALLSHLPTATVDLTGMPIEILRGLCEAFRTTITYDRETRQMHYTAEIGAGTIGRSTVVEQIIHGFVDASPDCSLSRVCSCGCARQVTGQRRFMSQDHYNVWLSVERYVGRNRRRQKRGLT